MCLGCSGKGAAPVAVLVLAAVVVVARSRGGDDTEWMQETLRCGGTSSVRGAREMFDRLTTETRRRRAAGWLVGVLGGLVAWWLLSDDARNDDGW